MALLYVFPVGDYIVFRDAGNVFLYEVHFSEMSLSRTLSGEIGFMHRRDAETNYPIEAATWSDVVDESGTPYSVVNEDDFLVQFNAVLPTSGGGGSVTIANPVSQIQERLMYDPDVNYTFREKSVYDPITNIATRTYTTIDGSTPYAPTNPDGLQGDTYFLRRIDERDNDFNAALGAGQPQYIYQDVKSAGNYSASTLNEVRKLQLIALTGTFSVSGITYPITTVNGVIDSFAVEATTAATLGQIDYTVDAASTVLEIIQY